MRRSNAALWCDNDAGGRFTIRPSGYSHESRRLSRRGATSCGFATWWPWHTGRSRRDWSNPLAGGSVRRSGECVLTTRPPPPGVAPAPVIPRGKADRPLFRGVAAPRPPNPSPPGRCRTRALGSDLGTSPVNAGRNRRTPSRRDCWSGSDPRGRGQGCARAPAPSPAAGPRTAGSLRSWPPAPARHLRSGGRDATARRSTTSAAACVHRPNAIRRTPAPDV